jgi:glutathione peroxidase
VIKTLLTIWLGSTAATAFAASELYTLPLKTIDGAAGDLSAYRGKTLLIVNTASKCGYTRQYKELQKLFEKYRDRGLVVLGFPSNDFGGQEPGTDAEIKTFCQTKFAVKFPLFAKAPVTGENKQPVFKFLTTHGPTTGEVEWNFEKFLVTADGEVKARFGSSVAPEDNALRTAIESTLALSPKR